MYDIARMDEDSEDKKIDSKIYSITDLNLYVKSLLRSDDELQNIWVKGEISNFTHHEERHMYFVLKDENSEISCAMFKADNEEIDFEPEEGMEILCRGNVSLYTARGQYQLVIKEMYPGGLGKLYLAYQQLKEKLEEEGLFEDEHKKEIPYLPKKVGIVTSLEGAALRDILSILRERFPGIEVLIHSVPVQGEGACDEIAEGIKKMDDTDIDVLIVGRGGGSIEDLWNFNEEIVARTIFDAKTPIISAVGHETDFLISDFVADERGPTPSAAAEMVVPLKDELVRRLREQRRRAGTALKSMLSVLRERLDNLSTTPIFRDPELLLEERYQRLDENREELFRSLERYIRENSQRLKNQKERLHALGPERVLERGYSILMNEGGEIIRSVEEVDEGKTILSKLSDGELKAEVKEVDICQKKKKG